VKTITVLTNAVQVPYNHGMLAVPAPSTHCRGRLPSYPLSRPVHLARSTGSGFWPSRDATSRVRCCVIVGYLHGPTMIIRSVTKKTQLMLSRRATRLEILTFEKYDDLETGVGGHWRSLEMSPFDRTHATSYWCSIVTMALYSVVSEIFNVEKCCDLEIRVRAHSRSLKVVLFDRLAMIFVLVFYSNFGVQLMKIYEENLMDTLFWTRRSFPSPSDILTSCRRSAATILPRPSSPPWAPKRLARPSRRQRGSSFSRPTRSHAYRCSCLTRQHGGE